MQPQQIHPAFDRSFIEKAFAMILEFLETTLKGENKVINFKLPAELKAVINFDVDGRPCPKDELIRLCAAILDHQVKPYHPHFHNQLFGGFDQNSYIGALMAPSINGSVFTYQISPCYTLMENTLYEHLRTLVGWKTIDATMTPGGSFANFMGLLLSRHKLLPQSKTKGLYGQKPLKVFTSDVSHYSIKKGVVLCGIGSDNIVSIKTDQNRRMIPQELEKAIEQAVSEGCLPLMVNATIGTTVQGNIDPITEIGKVCKKHGVWLHVDAAFGGAFLFSELLRPKLGSFQDVDSITFDPHKALVVPLQSTFFLCKHVGLMHSCNATNADYLFHKQRASYDSSLDVGDKTLQCGRVIDVIKLWTYLKGNGWQKIAEQVQNQHRLALHIKSYVQARPDRYQLVVQEVDTFNVCYWYFPQAMSKEQFASEEEYYALVSKLTVLAKKYMIEEGKILIGYSKSKLPYYFWRPVMSNPFLTTAQVDIEMELIAHYCEKAYTHLTQL